MELLKQIKDVANHQKSNNDFVGYILYEYNQRINTPGSNNISFVEYLDTIKELGRSIKISDLKAKPSSFYYSYHKIPTALSKATVKLKKNRKLTRQESRAVLNKLEQMRSDAIEPKTEADLNSTFPKRVGTPLIIGCYTIYGDAVYFKNVYLKFTGKAMQILKYLLKAPNRTATRNELATALECRNNPKLINKNIDHLKNYLKPFYDGKRTSIQQVSKNPLTYKLRLPEEPEETELA